MPELPEVEGLALDLAGRLDGRAIARVDIAAFSALKTFDPPLSALQGSFVDGVTRHGKFIDISAGGLHLVMHLARAGWVRWREEVPTLPPKPSNKSPMAARVHLDDGSGLDITEAGTKKSLALYVVRDPSDIPGIASLGPDPLDDAFTIDVLAGILQAAGRAQVKGVLRHQGTIAGIGNAYSDELLHAARMSPFKPASSITGDDLQTLYDAIRTILGDAVARSRGLHAADLKSEKKSNLARARPHRAALPGVRRHRARGVVRGLLAAVLPDLPDRRQALADRGCPGCSSPSRLRRGLPVG